MGAAPAAVGHRVGRGQHLLLVPLHFIAGAVPRAELSVYARMARRLPPGQWRPLHGPALWRPSGQEHRDPSRHGLSPVPRSGAGPLGAGHPDQRAVVFRVPLASDDRRQRSPPRRNARQQGQVQKPRPSLPPNAPLVRRVEQPRQLGRPLHLPALSRRGGQIQNQDQARGRRRAAGRAAHRELSHGPDRADQHADHTRRLDLESLARGRPAPVLGAVSALRRDDAP
jgi:hypothetical protein